MDLYDRNFQVVVNRDHKAKNNDELVGRYICEQHADGYAYYEIIKENKNSVRIKVITEIGDDWRIPYWGEEATIDKEYAQNNIRRREVFSSFFDADGV